VEAYRGRVRSTLRKRTEFLTILRHRDYRIYYLGLLASVTSHQAMMAVQLWLVFDMTGEPTSLGLVATAQALPGIAFNLVAGALADRWNPRRIIAFSESIAGVLMVILGTLVVTELVEVWHIVLTSFLTGIVLAFDSPARRVIWPVLIPRNEFVYAIAMNQGVWNGTRVISPAIGVGIVWLVGAISEGEERLGAGIAHYVVAAGFLYMVLAMVILHMPPLKRSTGATVLHDIRDGLVFTYRNKIFLVLLLMSFAVGYFGLSYQLLMPAFAKDDLHLGPAGLAVLLSASGVGGVIGIAGIASFGNYQNRAWLIGGGATALGLTIILMGVSGWLGLYGFAIVLAGLAGALYSVFQIGANTILNLLVPNEYRGRVMGLRGIMWGLSPLGALQAGFIATWVSTSFAIAVGGAAVIVVTAGAFVLSQELRNIRKLVDELEPVVVGE
jgi:MFS family permease